jgi:hypothetical protein
MLLRHIRYLGTKELSNAADSVRKHAASAELHGNMTAHNMYIVQNNVLVCITNTMFHNDTMNASACDQTIAGNIANHDLGKVVYRYSCCCRPYFHATKPHYKAFSLHSDFLHM